MPVYEYRCELCGKTFDIQHSMTEHHSPACTDCVKPLKRVFRLAGVSFKGSGFYRTDK